MSKSNDPDPSAMDKLTQLILGLQQSLASTEASMAKKFEEAETKTASHLDSKLDSLSNSIKTRLDKSEAKISALGTSVSDTQAELRALKEASAPSKIQELVDSAIANRLGNSSRNSGSSVGPRPRPAPRPRDPSTSSDDEPTGAWAARKDDNYWLARRQLRFWPIPPSDVDKGVRNFLTDSMKLPVARLPHVSFTAVPVPCRPNGDRQDQAVVTFANSSTRDEIRALARNLDGSNKGIGCQIEPPDHLRGHYQVFQNLAFCMKKKNPGLRRNIKFDDMDRTLVMDVKTENGWKTIEYATARNILKNRPRRTNSLSGCDVKGLLNKSDVVDSESSDSDMDEDVTIIESGISKNKNQNKRYFRSISFVNTNARSLNHKVVSLSDSFDELGLHFAQVTETWLQSNVDTEDLALRLRDGFSLGLIVRNRTHIARNGRQYGGVALLFWLSCKFTYFNFPNPSDFEVMATVGNIKGIRESVAVVTAYMPPNMTLIEARNMIEYISDLIGELKRVHNDCMGVLGGDFTQWPIEEFLEDHPEITEAEIGPTRGSRSIDRVFTNFHRSITESGTRTPLETEDGSPSDHKQAFVRAIFPKIQAKTIKYTYRPFTVKGASDFTAAIEAADWSPVYEATSSSDKTVAFQSTLEREMDLCFHLKTTIKRESDPPWVNARIRALGMKRRRVYDREGRSAKWKRLKKKKADLYRQRAGVFIETKKKNLTGPDASRFFFKHVKAFRSKEKPPDFNVGDLFPGKTEEEVSELLASHFGKISDEFNGIEEDRIPTSFDSPIRPLTASDVAKRLREARKAKSMVRGDIFPALINRVAHLIAPPLSNIYNTISHSLEWPNYWKTEFVTAIPKKPHPLNTNDLRNISCTPFLSKTYESFVLDWLGEQTSLRSNQYGGVKGCGTEHFLVEMWQTVLENLDDYRAASFITSIDYAKAFNRLDFARCLDALKAKGASSQLLGIVGSFLSNRMMSVKVGNSFISPQPSPLWRAAGI